MARYKPDRHEKDRDYDDDDRPRTGDGKVRLRSLEELDGRSAATRYDDPRLALLTLADLDGRSKAARLARDLTRGLERDLGAEPSTAQRQLIQRAALIGAVCEDQEARWLQRRSCDLALYSKLVSRQRAILEALGLERRARNVTPGATACVIEALREGADD